MLIALLVPLALAILLFTIILARSAIEQRALPNPEARIIRAVVSYRGGALCRRGDAPRRIPRPA